MSDAQIGYGTRFYMAETPTATVLTKLAEVTSVTPPEEEVAEVEVTHYESPGRTREFIAGLSDSGSTTIEMNWVPGSATDEMLTVARGDRLVRTMRIVTPPGEGSQQFTFPAYVSGYSRALPLDDRMTATVTLRISGAVTEADAATDPTVIAA
jgi:predicted secreted protein